MVNLKGEFPSIRAPTESNISPGKAVAATAMRLLEDPAILEQAKTEHKAKVGDGYVCSLPEDVQPAID